MTDAATRFPSGIFLRSAGVALILSIGGPCAAETAEGFVRFALERCVIPVTKGAPPNSSGMLRQYEKTDGMTTDELERYRSRNVYTQLPLGRALVVPTSGGCSALAMWVEAKDLPMVVEEWVAREDTLSFLSMNGDPAASASYQYAWRAGDRSGEIELRIDVAKGRAVIAISEVE